MIYLDNSATTRIDDHVLEAMLPWLRDGYGNASSQYALGRAARVAIEDARYTIADVLGVHPAEVIFTSGGTESNNAILHSAVGPSQLAHAIVHGVTEHHAILHPAESLEAKGVERKVIPVTSTGAIDVAALAVANAPFTLVSVMTANNETGVVNDMRAIRDAVPDALLHSDAVQAFGKIAFRPGDLGLDFATISAHKIHGPKGIGAMFIRKGIDFKAHQTGGAQERNRRSGTEPVALIVGFAEAARRAWNDMDSRARHMRMLQGVAIREIQASIPNVRFNTTSETSLPHIVNVSFQDAAMLDGEAILQLLDLEGVAASNGSACVSGSMQPSHVLSAMGLSRAEASAAVRFSVSYHTTEQEVVHAVAILADIIRKLRV
jgi:cysteine desulfurase